MDQADIAAMMRRLAQLVEAHYVFPGVGAELAALLARRVAAGRYANVPDEAALATLVTEDLQALNGDKHLRLLFSAEEVPDERDESAELAALARYAEVNSSGIARVERLDGNIGYLDLRPILFPPAIAGDAVTGAMSLLALTSVLIVDLRRCLGGDPGMVTLLCSYLFDSDPVHLADIYERSGNQTKQMWTLPYLPGRRFGGGKPVYVLTSATTFSGAEAFGYDLQQLGRVTVVGEQTRGGAHPREGFRLHPHLQATIPVARAINPVSGTNWEGTGVHPDIEVPAACALAAAYRRALEHVLSDAGDGAGGATAAEARRALGALRDQESAPGCR
jgi:Peptidase family S41/N-terminal domain of Peptidase_S41 in eukaryotic IRBP